MKELAEMTSAEISLAFAREVVGYQNAGITQGGLDANPDAMMGGYILPDYANDWNATIAAIKTHGFEWEKNHSAWLPEVGARKIRVETFSVRKIPKEKQPSGFWYSVDQVPCWNNCMALCIAAIKCARAEVKK